MPWKAAESAKLAMKVHMCVLCSGVQWCVLLAVQWWQTLLLLTMHGAGPAHMPAATSPGVHRSVSGLVSETSDDILTDVDVMECVQRPYEVKTHPLTVPDVGVADESGICGWKSPSLGSLSLWTAQPTNRIPGHTGYLITATLPHKHLN